MRFHCIGVGSVGTLVAFHLRRANPAPADAFTIFERAKAFRRSLRKITTEYLYVESKGIRRQIGGFDTETLNPTAAHLKALPVFTKSSHGSAGRAEYLPPIHSLTGITKPEGENTIASLLVTTKAPPTKHAIGSILSRLNASSTIVLFQNGMGVHEQLIGEYFPDPDTRPNFIIASTTHGVWTKKTRDVVHTSSSGHIKFAIVPDPLKRRQFELQTAEEEKFDRGRFELANISTAPTREDDPKFFSLRRTVRALLRCTDLSPEWLSMQEMDVVLRRKVVANACIGPLTAMLECRNGALYGNRSAHRVIRDICEEAALVFSAEAEFELTQERAVSPTWSASLNAKSLEASVHRIIRATAPNFSSMLGDARFGRVTEVEFINGYLCREAARLGVEAHVNETLLEMIRMTASIPRTRVR